MDDVGDGYAGHGVEWDVSAHVGYRLEHDAPNRRVLQAKLDDGAHLIGVDPALDGGDENGGHTGVGQAVEGQYFGV